MLRDRISERQKNEKVKEKWKVFSLSFICYNSKDTSNWPILTAWVCVLRDAKTPWKERCCCVMATHTNTHRKRNRVGNFPFIPHFARVLFVLLWSWGEPIAKTNGGRNKKKRTMANNNNKDSKAVLGIIVVLGAFFFWLWDSYALPFFNFRFLLSFFL